FSILLIDEQGIQRDIIQRNLERQKYQVTTVTNGLSARRLLDEVSFDLVISEMMIPKVSSFTLRKELLATSGKKRVPFIMMSANKNETSVKRAMGLGITHFLQKPVMMAELLGIVGYFEKISAEREG
ncbi:MAG: response regulator, partial [Sphaerochaetaceae bacterium]|nr:response regulator [Sphaerochaetaceae bacterium]